MNDMGVGGMFSSMDGSFEIFKSGFKSCEDIAIAQYSRYHKWIDTVLKEYWFHCPKKSF